MNSLIIEVLANLAAKSRVGRVYKKAISQGLLAVPPLKLVIPPTNYLSNDFISISFCIDRLIFLYYVFNYYESTL